MNKAANFSHRRILPSQHLFFVTLYLRSARLQKRNPDALHHNDVLHTAFG